MGIKAPSWASFVSLETMFLFLQRQKVESTNTAFWPKKWASEWFGLSEKWLLDTVVYALLKQAEHFSGLESDRVCKLWKDCCADVILGS